MPYRPEHLSHFKTLSSLKPPQVIAAIGWMITLGVIASVLLLLFVPWLQTAQGRGVVATTDPGDRAQDVTALVGGRLERWYVRDGQQVKAGDPIAQIVDLDPDLLTRLAQEREQVLAEIAAVQQARSVAAIDVGRTSQLLKEGLAARRDFEQAQIKVADADAKLAESRAKLNRIDVQLNRQSAQQVTAPRAGRIQTLNAAAGGGLVSAGTVLAVVAPERTERVVELYIDGRDLPLVQVGGPVRLEFEGWPAIQFSGWPVIAQGLFDGQVRAIDPTAAPTGLFRVIVEPAPRKAPWPDQRFVRLGGKVRGWVQGRTVTVGYELWRQLNDFPLDFGPGGPTATSAAPAKADSKASAEAK